MTDDCEHDKEKLYLKGQFEYIETIFEICRKCSTIFVPEQYNVQYGTQTKGENNAPFTIECGECGYKSTAEEFIDDVTDSCTLFIESAEIEKNVELKCPKCGFKQTVDLGWGW